jgi:hypothetical protein
MKFRLLAAVLLSAVIGALYVVASGGLDGNPSSTAGSSVPSPSGSTPDERALRDLKIN